MSQLEFIVVRLDVLACLAAGQNFPKVTLRSYDPTYVNYSG